MSARPHILVLDSKDRINPLTTSTNPCTLRFNPAIKGFSRVELLSLSVPMVYNVTSNNNQLPVNFGGSDYICYLREGVFQMVDFVIMVADILLLTTGLAFTVDYDAISLKFTITAPIAVSLLFSTFPFYSANTLLGFELQDYYSATNFLAPNAVNLSLPLFFYVDIDELGIHVKSSNENDFGTFVIQTTTNGGQIETFNMFTGYQLLEKFGHKSMQSATVTFKTRGNIPIDLLNLDWSIILKLHYDHDDNY